jgi:hypothetical protein
LATWVFGVDASFEELTLEEAQRLKGAGVKLFVQCLWTGNTAPPHRITNLRNASLAGIAIAGYISLNGFQGGVYHFDAGTSDVPEDLWGELKFIACDVELPNILHSDIVKMLDMVRAYGKKPVVYTNWNSWHNHVIPFNPPAPRWDDGPAELWNAYWDNNPDLDFPSLPFGDWTVDEVVMEQWSGGTLVEGQFVDQNTVNADKLGLLEPSPIPELPTQDEARAALEVLRRFVG